MEETALRDLKQELGTLLGLSYDALHIHIGLAVFLVSVLVFRMPLRSLAPLAAVLAVVLVNEAFDLYDDLARGDPWRWQGSLRDIFDTLLWPTVLWVLLRYGWLR